MDDPKHITVLGYVFVRQGDSVYRCHSLELEIRGRYTERLGGHFRICRTSDGAEQYATTLCAGKVENIQTFPTRTRAAITGLRKLLGITKARKGSA